MRGRARTAIFAIAVLVLAAGVAMAVFGGSGKDSATSMGTVGGGGGAQLPAVAATDAASPSTTGTTDVLDPAKQEPVLDLFVAKDPFLPLGGGVPTPTPEPTPTPTPTPTPSPTPNPINADVSIDGAEYNVAAGDETPASSPAFYVASLAPTGVTFELIDGQTFDDGSTSVEVAEGQDVVVTNADTGDSYRLSVISLNYSGGGEDKPVQSGHSIQLLSINTQNGNDTATFKVDGTTYADQAVGAVFVTGWGEIKILAIDAGAQTVTILHGDDTLVLHVGQIIEK
jgi:hypothetical protein